MLSEQFVHLNNLLLSSINMLFASFTLERYLKNSTYIDRMFFIMINLPMIIVFVEDKKSIIGDYSSTTREKNTNGNACGYLIHYADK